MLRIVTAKDVPGENRLGTFDREQPVFCDKEFNFLGDMLALVVAESEEQARAAARAVKVSWQAADGIYTIEDGIAKGSILHGERPPDRRCGGGQRRGGGDRVRRLRAGAD